MNCLDGYILGKESIIIMTTNYPEKLDKALIRPGRIDVHLKFEYCTRDQLQEMYEFITKSKDLLELENVDDYKISPCEANNVMIKHRNESKLKIEEELLKLCNKE